MASLANEQIEYVKEVFSVANKNDKYIFIKGGWNIDLRYGKPTREHNDIDFHFDINDKVFWIHWHKITNYKVEQKDDFYTIFGNEIGIISDFEGVDIFEKNIKQRHGGKSKLSNVVDSFIYEGIDMLGMRLDVEKYLKERGSEEGKALREKDVSDLNLINELSD